MKIRQKPTVEDPKDAKFVRKTSKATTYALNVDTKGVPIHAIDSKGRAVCGSVVCNQTGKLCQSRFRRPNGRCRKHGGNTLKGAMHPSFKHGRNSKYSYIPLQSVRDSFDKLVNDEELISLHDEAAITAAHMGEIISKMDESLDTQTLSNIEEVLELAEEAAKESDFDQLRHSLIAIRGIVEDGKNFRSSWDEYYKVQSRFQSLVEAERREKHTKHKQIAEGEFLGIMTSLAVSTKRICSNERLLAKGTNGLLAAFSILFDRITTGQPMTSPLPVSLADYGEEDIIDTNFREVMEDILESSADTLDEDDE